MLSFKDFMWYGSGVYHHVDVMDTDESEADDGYVKDDDVVSFGFVAAGFAASWTDLEFRI